MASDRYSDEELNRYFSDKNARRAQQNRGPVGNKRKQAVLLVGGIAGAGLFVVLVIAVYMLFLQTELPSLQRLENPRLDLATIAYTADGEELARYHRQNRTWVTYDQISPYVINALIATEDHRFYDHWGMDLFRTASAIGRTLLGNRQGGSTITQQLARNLYTEIGTEVSISRKLREMMTAIQIERNYTKREILEMYLNTVPFRYNAYGIESASRTYFGKPASVLNAPEAATLVGMLKGSSFYDPVRNHDRAMNRRNIVLRQMVRHNHLREGEFLALREEPIELNFSPTSHTTNLAPYFAEYVRLWLNDWARGTGYNIYTDGLIVHTTLDSRMQRIAQEAALAQAEGLQAVVDVEWSRPQIPVGSTETADYVQFVQSNGDLEPFEHFWNSRRNFVDGFVRETDRYRQMVRSGEDPPAALAALRADGEFMDSLRTEKTRLEIGFVAMDPRDGHVRAWVGGRDYAVDMYDHVAIARRQPGSTFKPFVYTAAIDNGYSPYNQLLDEVASYEDPHTGQIWSPRNFGHSVTGEMMTLREGLVSSINTVTAALVDEVGPQTVADYARRMGIRSPLYAVPSIALGTSDVTLLEMSAAYATLAAKGIYNEPVVVTRIEDRYGNVIADFYPNSREALSESTAYTVYDMMRGVINNGTGYRIRWRHGIHEHDLAGKTGTTQESADGWFVLMHPHLVGGAWVGFNDRRVTFRSSSWGQGSRNALPIVGDFFRGVIDDPEVDLDNVRFEVPENYVTPMPMYHSISDTTSTRLPEGRDRGGRIGW